MNYTAELGHHSKSLTVFRGPYINLSFQDGSPQEYGANGTTNEEIIQLLITRIESLNTMQDGKFHSGYNDRALDALREALSQLEARTQHRRELGIEGTDTP